MRTYTLPLTLAAATVVPTDGEAQTRPQLPHVEIQTVVTKMLHAVDALDWRAVRSSFTPEVRIDYTSLFGGQAETLVADTLLGRWRGLLPGFDATQHQIGPVVVVRQDDTGATAETQVRGYHHIARAEGGHMWMVAGRYLFTMEPRAGTWRIAGITFHLAYQEGNLKLAEIAASRVASGQGRARGTR